MELEAKNIGELKKTIVTFVDSHTPVERETAIRKIRQVYIDHGEEEPELSVVSGIIDYFLFTGRIRKLVVYH